MDKKMEPEDGVTPDPDLEKFESELKKVRPELLKESGEKEVIEYCIWIPQQ